MPHAFRRPHDQIQRERSRNGASDLESLFHVPSFVWHDDQNVDVAVVGRMPLGVGTEEDHAFGIERANNRARVLWRMSSMAITGTNYQTSSGRSTLVYGLALLTHSSDLAPRPSNGLGRSVLHSRWGRQTPGNVC